MTKATIKKNKAFIWGLLFQRVRAQDHHHGGDSSSLADVTLEQDIRAHILIHIMRQEETDRLGMARVF